MTYSKVFNALAFPALLCFLFVLLINAQKTPVTEVCLGCICEAISGCNPAAQCFGDVCGIFRITKPYWIDSGRPTLNNENPSSNTAYPNCVNDPYCAANSVQNYMTKFGQDCNNDNVVDCYDYAAIHLLGGYGCKGALRDSYANVLNACIRTYNKREYNNFL